MNSVDVIYSAWPALLYTNPAIGRYLLEPVLAYQIANPVQDGYAIHDLGEFNPGSAVPTHSTIMVHAGAASSYPNVTGSNGKILTPVYAVRHILNWPRTGDYPVEGLHQGCCGFILR